jgi:hypothetical protein
MAKRKRTTTHKSAAAAAPEAVGESLPAAPSTAPPTAPSSTSSGSTSRKALLREAAERKQRRQNMLWAAGAVALVLLIVAGVALGWRNAQPVVGETTFAAQGNTHIPLGSTSPVAYNSVPPTSGPHYENLAGWGRQPEPVRYEHLIHNLEDGGVVIYYQCPEGCPELVDELEAVLEPYFAAGRHVVLTPNDPEFRIGASAPLHGTMDARIALTAWRKQLLLDEVDAETIRTFIERYEGIDNHRG